MNEQMKDKVHNGSGKPWELRHGVGKLADPMIKVPEWTYAKECFVLYIEPCFEKWEAVQCLEDPQRRNCIAMANWNLIVKPLPRPIDLVNL